MTAYECTGVMQLRGTICLGILPERRRVPERITRESIMNWGRMILGDTLDLSNLSFVQVTIDENTDRISYP